MSTVAALATALIVLGSVLLLASLVYTRRGLMTVRYGLGWLAVSAALVVAGALSPWLTRIGRVAGLSRTEVILGGLLAFLVLLAFQLSVSVSRLQDVVRDLAEAHALDAARESPAPAPEPLPESAPESAPTSGRAEADS
mgnify:CR=1 FL=1